jgi:hypothetical protein
VIEWGSGIDRAYRSGSGAAAAGAAFHLVLEGRSRRPVFCCSRPVDVPPNARVWSEVLLERLTRAQWCVRDAKGRLERQRATVERLTGGKRASRAAEELLETFERVHAQHTAIPEELRKELIEKLSRSD